jgi:DNA-binding beta-propeller fold protein YncE
MRRVLLSVVIGGFLLAGCGGGSPQTTASKPAVSASTAPAARKQPPRQLALVTAETRNRVFVVDLRTGRIKGRLTIADDPEFAATGRGGAVVVSPGSGSVTLLDPDSMRPVRVLRGFDAPHIAEISHDGRYAYVTDDARGQLAVIGLRQRRILARIPVGRGAHHLAIRPDGRQLWLALGESARTIVIVDTSDPADPSVTDRFDPGFPAHDLVFTPDGSRVWITSSTTSRVGVFDAQDHRRLFSVPGGSPPQHVVFQGRRAYVTSGYGRTIALLSLSSGHRLRVVHAPYGSFNLAVGGGFVADASLLRGSLAIYDKRLRPLRTLQLAPAARDVAISPP